MIENVKIIDCHIHYALPVDPKEIIDVMKQTNTDWANLVIVPHRQRISSVPDALMVKMMYPKQISVFGSLDVTQYFLHQKSLGKHFVTYVKRMMACGCDGIKMIEGKPQMRKTIPIPDFDSKVWDPFWEYAQVSKLPILWHVNDPEEFWDINKIPSWAKARGWFYDKTVVNNEDQYRQVINVLNKYPLLKITFAHFFFMSAQLPRLAALFDRFPNISVDLTPGIEMYINLSKTKEEAQAFFIKYQDRIMYGTDIGARSVLSDSTIHIDSKESLRRCEIVKAFLENEEEFLIQADGNFLIGTDDFSLRGLGLEESVKRKIYADNFQNFIGGKINPVSPKMVIQECHRLKLMIKIMSIFDKTIIVDYSYLNQVEKYFKSILCSKK